MATLRNSHVIRILPIAVMALVALFAAPVGAAAAPTHGAGAGIEVAIPGAVSLVVYLTVGLVLLGLMVARHRPTA